MTTTSRSDYVTHPHRDPTPDECTEFILVTDGKAFGPFESASAAEYAAMDYWGTAVTGADIKILPLLGEPCRYGGGFGCDRPIVRAGRCERHTPEEG